MLYPPGQASSSASPGIQRHDGAPPTEIRDGYVGPVWLPQSGRMVWWTGRVAIGLRHHPRPHMPPTTQSSLWVQSLLLN